MNQKLIGIVICMLFVAIPLQFVHAADKNLDTGKGFTDNAKDVDTLRRTFTTCYIEATGLLAGQWKIVYLKPFNNEFAVVCVWKIFLGDDGKTTIFNKENGRMLYEHQGRRELLLVGFMGDYYNPSHDYYGITIKGTALLVKTSFYIP